MPPVSWEDLDPALVQEIQCESSGHTLDVLKDRLRPRDAVTTTPGGDEFVVSDAVAPNTPCRVPNPDVVSECGLSELPSSIHSDDQTDHNAIFGQTCVDEVESAEYGTPQKPPVQAERVCGLQEEGCGKRAMLRWRYPLLLAVESRVYGRYL